MEIHIIIYIDLIKTWITISNKAFTVNKFQRFQKYQLNHSQKSKYFIKFATL